MVRKKWTGHLIFKQFNFDVISYLLDLALGKVKEHVIESISLSLPFSLSLSRLISYCLTLDSILMMSPTQNSVMLEFLFSFTVFFFPPGVIHLGFG